MNWLILAGAAAEVYKQQTYDLCFIARAPIFLGNAPQYDADRLAADQLRSEGNETFFAALTFGS